MSALGMYASLALICVSSAIVGQGVRAALSDREWSWISPAVGLATLLVVGGLAIRLPGRATTAAVALVVTVVAALAVLWWRGVHAPGAIGPGIAVFVAVVIAASVPFAAAGAFGVLGPDVSWDIITHVTNAEWLRSHQGPQPPQVASGYPLGPLGLAASVSELTGAELRESFTAILIAGAVVTALTSLAVLRRLPGGRRTLACLLVGLPYLAASFYVQSAFKETLMGMLVLAFALGLRQAAGEDRERTDASRSPAVATGVALGLLAAAAVQTYSFAGLAWLAATVAFWALAATVVGGSAERGGAWARMVALIPAAGAAIAVLALATLPDLPRILDFVDSDESRFADTATANLTAPVPPSEALGVWLRSDYRFEPSNVLHTDIWAAIGLLALGLGIVELARRRELALLAGVASVAAAYLSARALLGIYSQSKALAIASPLIMLTALCGVLGPVRPLNGRGRTSPRLSSAAAIRRLRDLVRSALRGNVAPLGRAVLAVVFVTGALASSYLVLAGARIHRDETSEALARLRAELNGHGVLFLGSDLFARSELYGLLIQPTPEGGRLEERGAQATTRLDFDTYVPVVLDTAEFVITGRTPYTSEPPPNFDRVSTVGPFVLWERTGPTPDRRTLNERGAPGAVLDCSTPNGRRIAGRDGVARVIDPSPAHGPAPSWVDAAGNPVFFPQLEDGRSVSQTLQLTPGRWEISLQYMSPEPLEITAPGLDTEQPTRLEVVGPFWPVGTIEVTRRGPVPFTVQIAPRTLLGRALTAPAPEPTAGIGAIAATPVRTGRSTVPLREACGQFVDWYRVR